MTGTVGSLPVGEGERNPESDLRISERELPRKDAYGDREDRSEREPAVLTQDAQAEREFALPAFNREHVAE